MIHYTIQGTGSPIVLIHGFPNDSSAWDNITPALSEKYKVILPDLPGAGKSPLPSAPLSMADMARSVKEVLDKEGINGAFIAGHSMGGYTAMQFAEMYPESVKGISLIHALASGDNEEKKENRRKAILLMQKGEKEKEMFLKGMAQNLFSSVYARNNPEAVNKVITGGLKLSTEALSSFYTAIMHRTDKKEVLRNATFPVQWIIGNEDNATPMKDALEQCYLAPVNQVNIYEPCGHMSFVEMPPRLIADLLSFAAYCLP